VTRTSYEPCGRDRHHYPHITELRALEEVPYEPGRGAFGYLYKFEEIVCPGAGSDAMEVPK
jgi:hypothetical protein